MNYCLVIPDFRGIGGAQLYAMRRYRYLSSHGYSVAFAVALSDKLILGESGKDIPVFKSNEILSLAFDCQKKQRLNVADKFRHFCDWDKNTIIETFDPAGSTWGEIFATAIMARHVIYSLVEPIVYKYLQDKPLHDFFLFKYERGEYIGLSSMSLEITFGKKFSGTFNRFVNIAYDPDELPEKTKPALDLCSGKKSFVIGTVSRLEKPYLPVLIDSVIALAGKCKESSFILIAGGDSEVGDYRKRFEERYKAIAANLPNLIIQFPGYFNPLGKDFFRNLDVFIGMGTAAVSSISQACATIVIDPYLNLSPGIFGIHTRNFAYSETGKHFTLANILERVYNDSNLLAEAAKAGLSMFNSEFELHQCMKRLDGYISNSSERIEYWSFDYLPITHKLIRYLYNKKDSGILSLAIIIRRKIRNIKNLVNE
jgi:hypothetical protein